MKLWIAFADPVRYDQSIGMVVRAENEADARAQIDETRSAPEDGPQEWDVQPLDPNGPRAVLLVADQGA